MVLGKVHLVQDALILDVQVSCYHVELCNIVQTQYCLEQMRVLMTEIILCLIQILNLYKV